LWGIRSWESKQPPWLRTRSKGAFLRSRVLDNRNRNRNSSIRAVGALTPARRDLGDTRWEDRWEDRWVEVEAETLLV